MNFVLPSQYSEHVDRLALTTGKDPVQIMIISNQNAKGLHDTLR